MRTKNAQTQLIYDEACPLCRAYTKAFVSSGLLLAEQRCTFSTLEPAAISNMDITRAKHEIPLVNRDTGVTIYGIDALLGILEQKIPGLVACCRKKYIYYSLQQLYLLVSYNRRVITATRQEAGSFDCAPDFNSFYRTLFLCLGFLFNTAMLGVVQDSFMKQSAFDNVSLVEVQVAHLALVACNLLCAATLHKQLAIEYLGQINMLALLTILMLLPWCIVYHFITIDMTFWSNIWMLLLLVFIVKEYHRRMHYAGIYPENKFIVYTNYVSVIAFIFYLWIA